MHCFIIAVIASLVSALLGFFYGGRVRAEIVAVDAALEARIKRVKDAL